MTHQSLRRTFHTLLIATSLSGIPFAGSHPHDQDLAPTLSNQDKVKEAITSDLAMKLGPFIDPIG